MRRTTNRTIPESLDELKILQQDNIGTQQEVPINMLMAIKEHPDHTMAELARLVGCSTRSGYHIWNVYSKKGLSGVLQMNGRVYAAKQRGKLATKIRMEELWGLDDVREWLNAEDKTRYSRSEVYHKIVNELELQPPWLKELWSNESPYVCEPGSQTSYVIPARFLNFLNALPLSGEPLEWNENFRTTLSSLFDDVDHITVCVNSVFEIQSPSTQVENVVVTQHFYDAEMSQDALVTVQSETQRPVDRLLSDDRYPEHFLDQYHRPHGYSYYYGGCGYVGTIFFWRNRDMPDISQQTLDTIEALEQFIINAMASHVIVHHYIHPGQTLFRGLIKEMTREAKLSFQEQRVAIYHLLGFPYNEVGEILSLSPKTVKNHIHAVHRKSGVQSRRQLFARFLTPRLGFPPPDLDK